MMTRERIPIPRLEDDYSPAAAGKRVEFVSGAAGTRPSHIARYSLGTTEGTLVASYNRGMKLLHAAGGVKTTVMEARMQRAPAFGFDSAPLARAFGQWVTATFDDHRPVRRALAGLGDRRR